MCRAAKVPLVAQAQRDIYERRGTSSAATANVDHAQVTAI